MLVTGSKQHFHLLYPCLRVSGTANIACVSLPSKRPETFPCDFAAKNEEGESKTLDRVKMAKVKVRGWVDLVPIFARPKPEVPLLLCFENKRKCVPYAGYSK